MFDKDNFTKDELFIILNAMRDTKFKGVEYLDILKNTHMEIYEKLIRLAGSKSTQNQEYMDEKLKYDILEEEKVKTEKKFIKQQTRREQRQRGG